MNTDNIFETLNNLSLLQNLTPIIESKLPQGREIIKAFEGQIDLNGVFVSIIIAIDAYFPFRKPLYFVTPFDRLGFIPHIDSDGYICYMEDEGTIINPTNIEGIFIETFDKVKYTLLKGINKENVLDFINEFEVYWNRLNSEITINSLINHDDILKEVVTIKDNSGLIFAGNNTNVLANFFLKSGKSLKSQNCNTAIYIPLKPNSFIIPPSYNTFWDNKTLYNYIIDNLSVNNKKILKKLCHGRRRLEENIILKLPQQNGNFALFGINFSSYPKPAVHPLINIFSNSIIKPIEIKRYDKRLIIPRGGGDYNLNNKKILVVGCGSIGGTIALELAKSGITNITLVDNDKLSISNIYRNVLGNNKVEKYKVFALKEEIENKLPFTEITAINNTIEYAIKYQKIDLSRYDLIIISTGNPTINLYLNNFIKSNCIKVPIIFTWLEPYGIGGHALLSNNNEKNGCYECLYLNSSDEFYNIASFSERDQFFAKTVSGCGSLYTPFGSLDSLQTATLVIRLSINVLQKKEPDNPLLSWKGDSNNFTSANFKLSKRFIHQDSKELFQNRYLYKNPSCLVCSKGHQKL